MNNLFKNQIVIAFLLLSLASYAQVTRLNNQATGSTEYVGWNSAGTAKSLDIKNYFNNSYPINFFTTSGGTTAQRMTILSSGYVGIGTSTPNNLLQVSNLIKFDDANFNTFLGYTAGNAISTGTFNTFLGYESGLSTNSGARNSSFGALALYTNTILIFYLSKISDAFINTFFNNLTHYKILKILEAYCSSRFVAKSLINFL